MVRPMETIVTIGNNSWNIREIGAVQYEFVGRTQQYECSE